ncbi:MAG TPA: hypothetical protein PL019_08900 [Caldisericia bacterium]|nr:hypothetical protein [Caldisericia bacterium]
MRYVRELLLKSIVDRLKLLEIGGAGVTTKTLQYDSKGLVVEDENGNADLLDVSIDPCFICVTPYVENLRHAFQEKGKEAHWKYAGIGVEMTRIQAENLNSRPHDYDSVYGEAQAGQNYWSRVDYLIMGVSPIGNDVETDLYNGNHTVFKALEYIQLLLSGYIPFANSTELKLIDELPYLPMKDENGEKIFDAPYGVVGFGATYSHYVNMSDQFWYQVVKPVPELTIHDKMPTEELE